MQDRSHCSVQEPWVGRVDASEVCHTLRMPLSSQTFTACTGFLPANVAELCDPQTDHGNLRDLLTGPLCIRAISVGWYTLVRSCPL